MSPHFYLYLLDHNVDQLKSIFQHVVGILGVYVALSCMFILVAFLKHIMTEMSSFLAVFTYMFACKTSKTLHVQGITTSCTSVFCVCLFLLELSICLWHSVICSFILLIFLLIFWS